MPDAASNTTNPLKGLSIVYCEDRDGSGDERRIDRYVKILCQDHRQGIDLQMFLKDLSHE